MTGSINETYAALAAVPPVETDIAADLSKKALFALPVFVAIGAIGWGWAGVASVAIAVAIVVFNFLIAALIVTTCARISPSAMMGGVLFGYVFRLILIFLALFALKRVDWIEKIPLGISLIVLQLGLLGWETRYISGSLAYPGLKPKAEGKDK